LALTVFQLAKGIGAAQRLRRCDSRQHQALYDLLAEPWIRTSYNYRGVVAAEWLCRGSHTAVVPRQP
jgi:hypothetical protein